MEISDFEVLQDDLFERVGLRDISVEEKTLSGEHIEQLLGLAALFKASEQLTEQDQEKLGKFLEAEESERAQAFLTSRGIDLDQVTFSEVMRVKRAIIEADLLLEDTAQLELAIKRLLPAEVVCVGIAHAQAAALGLIIEMLESIDLPASEEMCEKIKGLIDKRVELRLQSEVPLDIEAEVDRLFDEDEYGQAMAVLLERDIDLARIYSEETLAQLEEMKQAYESLNL